MRWIRVALLVCGMIGCTRPNPARDCTDGTCSDPNYPFCDETGTISGEPGICLAVECAPGGVAACEGSEGLVCNAAGNGYDKSACSITCDVPSNTCLDKCTSHAQCTSSICKADGACAEEQEIVFTEPAGARYSDCSRTVPCTLERALELVPAAEGQYIALAAGNYVNEGPLTIRGKRYLIGKGGASTTVESGSTGPVLIVDIDSNVTLDSLRVANAMPIASASTNREKGWGVYSEGGIGTRQLRVVDVVFASNGLGNGGGGGGILFYGAVEIMRSVFNGNYDGAVIIGPATVNGSIFTTNLAWGLLGSGALSVTNSFIVRNQVGITINPANTTHVFAFNTVVDNTSLGVDCNASTQDGYAPVHGPDNIITGSPMKIRGGEGCMFGDSIVTDDRATLRFVAPDNAPFDYHIGEGSIAIDAAASTDLERDYDGDPRPKGNGRDVGADEAY